MTNPAVASKAKPPASHTHCEQASVFETFVPALTARGHGLQALCFFFSAAAELVLSSIVRIALPMPSDRPYRICYHDKAWTAEQIQQLMTCWPTGAYATVIGQRIGRSASSVRCKAKWLGLPGRPRSSLRRGISEASLLPLMPADAITAIENDPADTERAAAALSPAPDDVAPAAEQTAQRLADAAAEVLAEQAPAPVAAQAVESVSASEPADAAHSLPAETGGPAEICPAPASVTAAPATSKRRKIVHSRDLDQKIGDLWLRGMSAEAIGARIGRSGPNVESRAYILGLPGRHFSRGNLKMSCDLNEPHIEPFRSQRWQFASCMLSDRPLWRTANGPRISKAAKQTKEYQDKVASLDEAEYPVDD